MKFIITIPFFNYGKRYIMEEFNKIMGKSDSIQTFGAYQLDSDEKKHLFAKYLALKNDLIKFENLIVTESIDIQFEDNILFKIAVYNKSDKILVYLIQMGIPINIDNGIGIRICAATEEYNLIIKILIENGADMSVNDNYPIKIACRKNLIYNMKLFIDAGIDVNIDNGYLLFSAIRTRFIDGIKLLIDAGYDILAKSQHIIHYALKYSNKEIIIFLLSLGIDFSQCTQKDLVNLIRGEASIKTFEILSKNGVDFTKLNSYQIDIMPKDRKHLVLYQNLGIDQMKISEIYMYVNNYIISRSF